MPTCFIWRFPQSPLFLVHRHLRCLHGNLGASIALPMNSYKILLNNLLRHNIRQKCRSSGFTKLLYSRVVTPNIFRWHMTWGQNHATILKIPVALQTKIRQGDRTTTHNQHEMHQQRGGGPTRPEQTRGHSHAQRERPNGAAKFDGPIHPRSRSTDLVLVLAN